MNLFSPIWFMEGFWHSLQTPSHLILLVSLAILFGQQAQHNQQTLIKNSMAFVCLLCFGFVINHFYTPVWNIERWLLLIALGTSLLVIMRLKLSAVIVAIVSLSSATILGIDSKPIIIPGFGESIQYNWLAGVVVSTVILLTALGLFSFTLRNVINGVVLRVMGSWIATSALFVLTLLFVKH